MKINNGFSLIELLITIILLAILITLASPDLSAFIRNHVLKSNSSKLFQALTLARTEAILRNEIITVCGTEDFKHCSSTWNRGYIILIENKPDHIPLFSEAFSDPISLQDNGLVKISFTGEGRALSRGKLAFKTPEKASHQIVIFDSGRIRLG